ncbi:MAG: ATP-binding cassette domain-containing protein [Actinobacteria bacterium]|uniref:Unannotated protein n=1 Tax=freshwater metagenome TaxID=449393 RepID=A0A6J5ZPJ5_9ZZZZ|nr:ATP-binding cassette domain-containing protein [Actinomycetota bacterium]
MSISIRNLTHVYATDSENVVALSGLDLDVPDGQVCVMRGPNGSGKSTLIEVLATNIIPTSGTITTHTESTAAPKVRVIRQFDHAMEDLSVAEYIQTISALNQNSIDVSPYQEVLLNKLHTVSPGVRQLIAVDLALAADPDILLADEPAASLNSAQSQTVYQHLAQSCRNRKITLLLVTHDKRAEAYADRIVRIRDGRISEQWQPNQPEEQVVDSHGWLRLPDEVVTHSPTSMRATITDQSVQLDGLRTSSQSTSTVQRPTRALNEQHIIAAGLSFRFSHDTPVLNDVSFTCYRNALNVVLGASGSGKSTLMRILSGLQPPDAGTVSMDSTDIYLLTSELRNNLRSNTCALFGTDLDLGQHQSLKAFAVRPELLNKLNLAHLAARPLLTLSGGQRQRAKLAIALSHPARTLILDEPTTSLDVANRNLLIDIVQAEIDSGRTIILATHDDELAEHADHLITLT